MIESPDILAEESAAEADEIDFVPDPSQLGRVPREPAGMPRWLVAALATAAVVVGVMMFRPGPAVAHAAGEESTLAEPSGHQDLFQLPEWHEDQADHAGK